MIYFDNASTSKVDLDIVQLIYESMKEDFANPSSLHSLGFKSEKIIEKARGQLAGSLGVRKDEIYFTPSGTIANNIVINSISTRKGNVVTSKLEHSSVYESIKHSGLETRYVKTDQYGFVDEEDFLSKIDESTLLVSLMHVNNELGTINDIERLASLAKTKNRDLVFHSDGVQAFKKYRINLKNVDFYTISAHKINGPKGIAALYVKKGRTLENLYYGGQQEKGIFPGTENVSLIRAFGELADREIDNSLVDRSRNHLLERLKEIPDIKLLSPLDRASSYIVNLCIADIRGEILLHYLEEEEIYIGTGSACNKREPSRVIDSLDIASPYKEGCVRISFDKNTNPDDVDRFIEIFKKKIEEIRKIMR